MADLDPPDAIRVYFNARPPAGGLRYPGTAVSISAPRFWTLRALSLEVQRRPPNVLFVPSHVIPPVHPPTVVTVHDVGYLVEPDSHEPIHRRQLEWTTRWNCRASRGIIAISESTRQDLIDRLAVDPAKIRVIYHGISPHFAPASDDQIAGVRSAYHLPEQFILAVGSVHPRKNLVRLIQAFELIAGEHTDLELMLCGNAGWQADRILERCRRSPFANRIRHIGFVPDRYLPALYSAATITAFVSLYEGFGLPALESMACGTPVVASNRSALPEICGDAALLIDPFDSHAIAEGVRRMLTDESLRHTSIERGMARARTFTWRACAEQTLAFLRAIRDN